ncbi:MAG: tetratricopeptide repeat protein [Nitrospirae bacterium]|nr:tetratricopeptide repeat protein [Nitrospirota bacterium]
MRFAQNSRNGDPAFLLLPVVIVAVVSFAVYFNALGNGFIYDDHSQVLKNYLIRDAKNIPELFRRSAWTFEGAPPTSNYYRPMLNLLYMLEYHLFGLEAWGYHLVNILFHVANSVLVFFLTARLSGEESKQYAVSRVQQSTYRSVFSAYFSVPTFLSPPFIAGLLFAVNPIHTEAVTWIAGLSDVSFAFFFLFSFYLYVLSAGSYRRQYLFSLLFFSLAVLSKEPALTLPVILITYDYAFRKGQLRIFDFVKRHVPYILVICGYLIVRFSVLGAFTPLKRLATLSTFQLMINVFPLFSRYLHKLLLPLNLNFWPVFDPLTSLLSKGGLLSLCVTTAFAGLMLAALRKNRAVFFCLVFIAVPLAPALYIKGIIGKPFADRYLYLPSFGFAMLLAFLLCRIKAHRPCAAVTIAVVFTLLAGLYSFGTISRNRVWKDDYSLFSDTVKKSPDSVVPRLEYGNALLAKGLYDEAVEQFQAARTMEPMLYVIYHHLGLALAGKGRLFEAVQQYRMALTLNPNIPEVHTDLGRAYAGAGFRGEAVQEFRIAVALKPAAPNYNLLGIAYAQNGETGKAEEAFRIAVALDPAQADYRRNLARALEFPKSPSGAGMRNGDLSGTFEERPASDRDLFRFAW